MITLLIRLLAKAIVLVLFFVSGGVLHSTDPASTREPWVIIDGKKVPHRDDGRYIIDGVPTLAIEGKKGVKQEISTHAPTNLFPEGNLSDLLKKTTEQIEKRNKELNRWAQ